MKSLVVYYSETGNTKKVAEAIYEGIQQEREILDLGSVKDLKGYDLIFFGFPVISGKMAKKAAEFLETNSQGRRIALFCTQGAAKDSKFALGALEHAKKICSGATVSGTFNCRGEVVHKILEAVSQKPEFHSWVESAKDSTGHPDQSDLEQATEFAKEVVLKVTQ
jgi:flavodoxin